jgi:hypothetical protein
MEQQIDTTPPPWELARRTVQPNKGMTCPRTEPSTSAMRRGKKKRRVGTLALRASQARIHRAFRARKLHR